ncbi:hypothetical protein NitYY0826_C1389 [Nitratiruptor sp. YY08-26]|uniref:recombination protein RecO n=1 Tax=unclassified Nitratiruptor TaxID=2624044 RepID=UPI0019167E7E|nr:MULTISPECIES: recombination protein RecO [unclassified Nitratiruptor]BCD62511.1 hypothetical protein NitYY0813_C1387 [Nitratiruptor sp. YY08-13]BCD66447.1 hypothetical protein NitYY0826_C1389 [Nitratiruptor sp. YY08-26]
MQGYILNITRAKNEDLIVHVLTHKRLYTLYRFYGARHATINLGYKIDFTIEQQLGFLPKLRNITHLGYSWLKDLHKSLLWQQFIKLLYLHLRDLEDIESFYMEMLDSLAKKFTRQNPKRAIIEEYVKLLEYEGRLHRDFVCFVCEQPIEEPTLVRSFLPAHTHCVGHEALSKKRLAYLFAHKDAQYLDDKEIERLWNIILQGL